jgi:hypothetical protein
MGSILVHVLVAGLPGAVPAGGTSTPKPQVLGPAAGATVQIIDPRMPDTLVAEQISDPSGEVRFDVAPATYWVIVPWNDHVTGLPGAPPVAQYLANGQAVLAWQDVTVAGASVDVQLIIEGALP